MKEKTHPKYYPNAKVTCACGNTFTVGSTKPELHVAICSACHPAFTKEKKFVDTRGRIERFEEKRKKGLEEEKPEREERKKKPKRPKTLKEMLKEARK